MIARQGFQVRYVLADNELKERCCSV